MIVIGHRGAKGLAPENTIASLLAGIENGVNGVEFDIRITADGIPVLAHNETIHDDSKTAMIVRISTLKQLRERNPNVCTLEEALLAIDRRVQALIELKPGEDPTPVVAIIRQFLDGGWAPTDFCFLSFKYSILKKLHAALPDIPIIVNEGWSAIRATSRARRLGTKQIDMRSWWLWPGVIRSLSSSGYQLYTYTLNNPTQARRWERYGLYGVVTDLPDRYRQEP